MNCQLFCPKMLMMALPTDAPKMFAIPYTPPTNPRAMPRFCGGNAVPNSAVAMGRMPPPPMACTARATSRREKLFKSCESPQNSEPNPKRRMLTRYMYLRPNLSASLPITGMEAAYARV